MNETEKRFEEFIETYLVSENGGWTKATDAGYCSDESKDMFLDIVTLTGFVKSTQPMAWKRFERMCTINPIRQFYKAFENAVTQDGLISVLRHGFKHRGINFRVCYFKPESELNEVSITNYQKNVCQCIRQWHYSKRNTNTVDMMLAVNGIPVVAIELKNQLTGQSVDDAMRQWQYDRNPNEPAFGFNKRVLAYFACDLYNVYMTTQLKGPETTFLPFNQGSAGAGKDGGAGNPKSTDGSYVTSYFWEKVLQKDSLLDILQKFINYERTERKETLPDGSTKKTVSSKVVFPRYHQLDVVRQLVNHVRTNGAGHNYLIQHSAGSGKSNSIAWTAYRMASLHNENNDAIFNSVIIITDRRILDQQLQATVSSFDHTLGSVVTIDEKKNSGALRDAINDGKRIIVTTLQKFPVIYNEVESAVGKHYAVIVDEAHSSQNGSLSANLATGISGNATPVVPLKTGSYTYEKDDYPSMVADNSDMTYGDSEDIEDKIHRIIKGRKMAKNANYYAFTATPKNKTLEMFGDKVERINEEPLYIPFHEYTMKQAIEEGFILDVLKNYTPYSSYYRVLKAVEDDPEYDKKKALGKIRVYVEHQPETIEKKAEIIVEHFLKKVYMKIGGKARAMVITSSIERSIEFYKVITKMLEERNSPYKAIVAFTDKVINGKVVTEAELNGFPSAEIEQRVEQEPYRLLIVADKFQTGYDQPLLHTMYVDKQISDLKAVQTLSRLNRCHPKKQDTFVLDFANDPEMIRQSFQRYYKTTILEGESDVNKLNDLTETIEAFNFYTQDDVDQVATLKLMGTDEDRPRIDSIIDAVVVRFKTELNEDDQIKCKSAIKNFNRCYPYFSAILPYESPEWEKQYVFYSLLVKKLPKLKIDDYTDGLLDDINFDKYRIVKEEERAIVLENEDTNVRPIPVGTGGGKPQPEIDALSSIVKDFNDTYGNIEWKNRDEVQRQIEELPARIATSVDFANAVRNGDKQVAQITFNDDIINIVAAMLEEKTEFVQTYFANPDFQNFVNARVFQAAVSQLTNI